MLAGPTGPTERELTSPLVVEVTADAQQNCIFILDGQSLSTSAFKKRLESESDKRRKVHISGSKLAPWRCIAGAVYSVQNSGFETVGFVTEPDPE